MKVQRKKNTYFTVQLQDRNVLKTRILKWIIYRYKLSFKFRLPMTIISFRNKSYTEEYTERNKLKEKQSQIVFYFK